MSALETQVGGDHYRKMKIQPVDFITQNAIPYREACAIKYICRHASKNGAEDLKKAVHYLQMIIDEYEGGATPALDLAQEWEAAVRMIDKREAMK